jgi:RNA polymerase sigma-32 factor
MNQAEIDKIAEDLGVPAKDVREMESRLNGHDFSFDAPSDGDDDENDVVAPVTYLEDHSYDPAILVEQKDWEDNGQRQLYKALKKLDARSQDILQKRWLGDKKVTLQVLAQKYQVSAERIRQIESNAMRKMKKTIKWAA